MLRSIDRRLARFALAGAAAAILSLALVPAAFAKEGVEVTLAAPISADAQPGDTVTVFFTLTRITEAGTSPLRGSPAFIRLIGRSGAPTEGEGVETKTPGTYRALVVIPAGGAYRAQFGIHGSSVDADGRASRSDIIWEYDGVLVAAQPPAPVDPGTFGVVVPRYAVDPLPATAGATGTPAATPAATPAPSLDGRLVAAAAAGAAVLAAVAGAIVIRRRQGLPPSAA
jgi:hypothetical protein